MKQLITYKSILFQALAAICALQCNAGTHDTGFYPTKLSDFTAIGRSFGAGVMPYYEDEKGEKYVLLGREVNSGLKREWAFFSGGSERTGDENSVEHPLGCATREFFEEAALYQTLGWDQAQVKKYIQNNTTEVIARYNRDVKSSRPIIMFVVKFEKKDIEKIISTFKNIFNDPKIDDAFKEKDALATVKYKDLIEAVSKNQQGIQLDKNLPHWFNKDDEDKALMYSVPYNLLRARYIPNQTFIVSGKRYHYVKDSTMGDTQKHTFIAQEPLTIIQSKL